MKLKISITTEPIEFSILGKIHLGNKVILGYFTFRFMAFFLHYNTLFIISQQMNVFLLQDWITNSIKVMIQTDKRMDHPITPALHLK